MKYFLREIEDIQIDFPFDRVISDGLDYVKAWVIINVPSLNKAFLHFLQHFWHIYLIIFPR